jgi:glycosyltransferase involved in cell wall biosynthesis
MIDQKRLTTQRISVCMATHNGARFIRRQLETILTQLAPGDEVVISDDSSTDGTLEIIDSFDDPRIRLFTGNTFFGPIFNFENALRKAMGEIIVLADQDDIWLDGKVGGWPTWICRWTSMMWIFATDCRLLWSVRLW